MEEPDKNKKEKPKGRRSAKKGEHENTEEGNKRGRPSKYSEELALEICSRIAEGESLLKICRDDHMPRRETVHVWVLEGEKHTMSDGFDQKGEEIRVSFSNKYARARELQAEYLFDETKDKRNQHQL